MDLALRNKIDLFEEVLSELPNQIEVSEMDVRHHFTDNGLYAREMIIPKGTIITGRIKKHEHISVISAGLVSEVTEDGVQNIRAPYTMVSKPGTKRIVWAHETTVWTTIHAVSSTDLQEVEDELIASSHEELTQILEDIV